MKSKYAYLCVIAIVGSLLGMTHHAGTLLTEDAGAAPAGDCADRVDDRVYNQYGISGYWMFPDSDQCRSRRQVESVHKIGGDTIVTSSTELRRSSREALQTDALFKDFTIDGADGYTAAEGALSAGESIERVFTYSAHYPFYSDALRCAGRSGAVDAGGKRYTYWLLPAGGEDACVAGDGKYSLVVAVNENGEDDAALNTVSNAELYNMKAYLGMPVPQMGRPGTPGYPDYVADDSYTGTLGAFTRNLLRSWMQAFGAKAAFAGLYQGRETSVVHRATAVHQHTLNVYASQNDVAASALPAEKRRVVFSPYASFEDPGRAAYLEDRFRDIVHTGAGKVDVILANFTVTPERAQKVDFAKPYMKVSLGAVSPKGKAVTRESQLAGKRVIVVKGTTADAYIQAKHPDWKITKFEQYTEATNALIDGRGDVWVTDNTEAMAFSLKNEDRFVTGITQLGPVDSIAGAVQKGNVELLSWLNEELVQLGEEKFFHKDYERTLKPVYGKAAKPEELVVEGGAL